MGDRFLACMSLSCGVQGGHQNSSRQQQHLGAGPELRLRLESLDADSGRSVKALVTADPNQSGPRLQKVHLSI